MPACGGSPGCARRRVARGDAARPLGAVASRRRGLRARVLRRGVGGEAMSDLFSLDGRSAIVTGGAGQIGAEIVRGVYERGAHGALFVFFAVRNTGRVSDI